jgi:glyoxylase-like metal-dependent hydrolase (beta-lactamase superfamily II)
MHQSTRPRDLARADRILPGLYRLRLPLPWQQVPHVNAYAIACRGGCVLVDCGYYEPGSFDALTAALAGAGFSISDVALVVCTHAHPDHYGLAQPVVEAAGCDLWMHSNHAHVTEVAADPQRQTQHRLDIAHRSGLSAELTDVYIERGATGIAQPILPDRHLDPTVEIQTELGGWRVIETPGHAPSHVVFYQPQRRLLLSGDHLLGRISLYYEYGYTPDPIGEYLASLAAVDRLGARLCLSGHGRPFLDVTEHIVASRRLVAQRLHALEAILSQQPKTPFELVVELAGEAELPAQLLGWYLSEVLCGLLHLQTQNRARELGTNPQRWMAPSDRA